MASVLIQVTDFLFSVCTFILLASIVMSWLVAFGIVSTSNPNVRQTMGMLDRFTEPVLEPIRRVLPNFGGIDFSPIIVFFLIRWLNPLVDQAIWNIFGGA